MWIVRLALNRPYTFVVMAILIAILGSSAIVTMPVDIFPYIDIPVVSVLWVYSGLSPEEMEKRVVTNFERSLTSNVNDIEHIESQAYNGYAVVKIYFHPNVKIDMAVAQTTATMQTSLRQMPPGMFPANILKYDAASVPILQLGLSSKTLREQEIFDIGNNFIRTPLGTVQGASVSYPFGGKQRAVMVDLNLEELYSKQLSPIDVSNALNSQNLILPAGTAKLAHTEYQVRVNSSPVLLNDLNNLPIKTVNGATVYIKDVAQVRDGFQVQNNIVRTNGSRGVLITITRNGKASTLSIVSAVKAALPRILSNVPPELKVVALADQSLFVRASIQGVLREALMAAGLTGMMILLFLGSWRSTLIVCISIPLSILTSLCLLSLLGETINVMTLGGLALAVGILVDDATVEIENTHRNIAMGKPMVTAVLDGASQIAVPTFVATLAICIVFVPVLLLTGTARYLFTPLAMAVVFAMLASYLLSRTLVPTMMAYLLGAETHQESASARRKGIFIRGHELFNAGFEALRYRYVGLLDWSLRHRGRVLFVFGTFFLGSLGLGWLVGQDFFPAVDSGQMRLHARGPAGTRIEETEMRFAAIEGEIRAAIPPEEIEMLIDNIGIPNSWPAIAQGDIPTISSADGEILISLNKEKHGSSRDYEVLLRKRLRQRFPDMSFFFQPANITSQILNFGLPAPIDLQVVGRNADANYEIAQRLAARISNIPGVADAHVHQVADQPVIRLDVDREKAAQMGLTQRDVTNSMLISLSGSGTVAPNFWMNWTNGISYNVGVQTPQYRIDSLDALLRTPISAIESGREQHHAGLGSGRGGGGRQLHRRIAERRIPGVRKSRIRVEQHATALQPGVGATFLHARDRQPLQRVAGLRRVCQCGPARPGRRGSGSEENHARGRGAPAARHVVRSPGADRDDAIVILSPGVGDVIRGGTGVPADDGELSILAGPLYHSDGAARSDGRHSVDAVHHGHDAERSLIDGLHHVRGRGHRQQHSDRHVRQRPARDDVLRARGDAGCRSRAGPAGADDGHRDDSWNGSHGNGFR